MDFVLVLVVCLVGVSTGTDLWHYGRHSQSKYACPTSDCRCDDWPTSNRTDLHCPTGLSKIPRLKKNELVFEWTYMMNMKVSRLGSTAFRHLRTKHLNLSKSRLFSKGPIAASAFVGVRKTLVELVLSSCELKGLPCRALYLSEVSALDLSGNQISVLKRSCLAGMPKLRTLRLDRNLIKTLGYGAFIGLKQLSHIDLSYNRLLTVEGRHFRMLRSLVLLDLSHNNVNQIGKSAFRFLRNMRTLNLGHNDLAILKQGMFQGLRNLGTLNINDNPLVDIQDGTFVSFRKLRHLHLNIENVTDLTNRTFQGLRNLRTLNLQEVGRTGFPNNVLSDASRLTELAFTNYKSGFGGVSPKVFHKNARFKKLLINVTPIYTCSCEVPWIRQIVKLGVQLKGQCFSFFQLSCTNYH